MATRSVLRSWLRPARFRPARFPMPRAAYTTSSKPSPSQMAHPIPVATLQEATTTKPKVGKLKELLQKYGMAGFIVYNGLSIIDLSFTIGAIQMAGQDKVLQLEKSVKATVSDMKARMFGASLPATTETPQTPADAVVTAEKPSFTSIFLLAYGIHKTVFLPFRLTVTAAITPAFVRKLHALGWTRFAPKWFGKQ